MDATVLLLVRMAIVAGIVVAVSGVVARAGPFLGAMLAVLPVSAGPAYVFLALDHDAAFVARSAVTSVLGVGAAGPFVLAHGIVARRHGMPASLAAALAAWFGTLLLMGAIGGWTLPSAFLAAVPLLAVAIVGTGRARRAEVAITAPPRRGDLLLRVGAVMATVTAVSLGANLLGPEAAGFAAMMPVVFVSLVAVLQPRVGGRAIAALLAHAIIGLASYVPAFVAVGLLAPRLGSAAALGTGLAVILLSNGILVLRQRRG